MGPAATELEAIRQRWADMSNQALERHGHSARIDHRTLSAQREEAQQKGDDKQSAELDREPTKHLGPSATAMERRGKSTDLGDINRRIAEAAESGRLQRERQATDRSILDLSGDLVTAIKDRDALRSIQPDSPMVLEARRQAREAWGEIRAAGKEAKEQLGLWKEAREQEARKQEAQRQAPRKPGFQRDGQQRDGPARVGTGKTDPSNAPTLGGFKIDQSLLDRVNAIGGRAADPVELERLLREWMQHQQQEKEQREERERGERQAGAGRSPHDPHDKRTQQERDRENAHRRHQDRGFER
jgi:MobA/MobL family